MDTIFLFQKTGREPNVNNELDFTLVRGVSMFAKLLNTRIDYSSVDYFTLGTKCAFVESPHILTTEDAAEAVCCLILSRYKHPIPKDMLILFTGVVYTYFNQDQAERMKKYFNSALYPYLCEKILTKKN